MCCTRTHRQAAAPTRASSTHLLPQFTLGVLCPWLSCTAWPGEGQLLRMVRLAHVNKRRFGKSNSHLCAARVGAAQTSTLLGAFPTLWATVWMPSPVWDGRQGWEGLRTATLSSRPLEANRLDADRSGQASGLITSRTWLSVRLRRGHCDLDRCSPAGVGEGLETPADGTGKQRCERWSQGTFKQIKEIHACVLMGMTQ